MASPRLTAQVGPLALRTPLIAASGTVGAVWEWARIAPVRHYGAAVAKSVAPEPWEGRPPPRVAPIPVGMLNGIGIQNPGIDAWFEANALRLGSAGVEVWGSAVAATPEGFAKVAGGLDQAGVSAIEVNLSCPNLEDGQMFSHHPRASAAVLAEVRSATDLPLGAKLSPDSPDLVATAEACAQAGADFVVLTNTARGFGVSLERRRPLLSGGIGGYSGPGLKPIALRCVHEVHTALPGLPVVGCGGVMTGGDVAEYLLAGASAVEIGTLHFAESRGGARVLSELVGILDRLGVEDLAELGLADG